MARVAVLGAGVGGLATAIRLAGLGHAVEVFEKNKFVGGKLASESIDGFTFDIGPSLLTMPQVFDDLGVNFERVRLAEPFRYVFADRSQLIIHDDLPKTAAAFEAMTPGGGAQFRHAIERGHKIWDISERTFFAGPMTSPLDLVRRMSSPHDLLAIDPLKTLHQRSATLFHDVRLQQWLDRYATYSGSSPYGAPATLGCIPYLEQAFGSWHVPGGLATIAEALSARARQLGVTIRCGETIAAVRHDADRVTGVQLASGETVKADVVVSNIDAEHFYTTILPQPGRLKRVRKAGRSTAGFAMLLGLSGATPELRHHNIWFSSDYRAEFAQIATAGVALEPTIYVCCSSITTPSEAPANHENWFVLVNVGAGAVTDWNDYGDAIIDRLGVRDRIVVRRSLPPEFYARQYNAPGGAIYGTSSNGRRSAFLRADNRGPLKGLYLVGGSSHPGGGLPLVVKSAEIVSNMIRSDQW